MVSKAQTNVMTNVLKLAGIRVIDYRIDPEIGIIISVEKEEKKAKCPNCGKKTEKLHQNHWNTVRDLAWGEQKVYLKVNRRQMRCAHCGKKFSEELEFVEKKRTYTKRLKEKIVREAIESDLKSTARRNGVSEQEIETMLKEIGKELMENPPKEVKKLGIDEIAIVKGQKNYYVVLIDIEKSQVVGIIEKRVESVIIEYLKAWGEKVLRGIEEVSIDLWKQYKKIVEMLMPQAEIVADRFHVMKQINSELDKERRKIKRETEKMKEKQKREKKLEVLKKSKYALLKNEKDLKEEEKEKLEEIKKEIPKLGRMQELKEEFREVFERHQNWIEGLLALADWLKKAAEYYVESCGTIRRWIGEIIAYFDHRTTQGVVEGMNNKLKLIKRKGYGFRNFDNFKTRVGLDSLFST